MHITITGKLGSGKSTICKILNDTYGYEIYSTGKIQREIANNKGISTLEMNKISFNDLEYDKLIDSKVVEISKTRAKDNIVFDSRMAWHFVEKSYKVYVTVDPYIAADRVISDSRGAEENYKSREEAKNLLLERSSLEHVRFKEIYGVDIFDYSNYNLIIDSTFLKASELTQLIVERIEDASNNKKTELLISPKSIYPTQSIRNINEDLVKNYMQKTSIEPIDVLFFEGYHYVIDGHHRWLSSILNKDKCIEARIIDLSKFPHYRKEENVKSEIGYLGVKALYDYEDVGKFNYASYPSTYDEGKV